MALLPANDDGTQWQMTTVGYADVTLIENPGTDDEKVHFRIDGKNKAEYKTAMTYIEHSSPLNTNQKLQAMFWLGYFYGHLIRF